MPFNHFKAALHDSFKEQKNCDVTFSCSDPTSDMGESTIMAHKFFLSLASDVFYTMFYGEAAKQENGKDEGDPIKIDDIEMPIFKLFLSFIYNMLEDFETTKIAAKFFYAAHKYNAKDALEFVSHYMAKEVKPENALELYDIACLYENQELQDACFKIFSEDTVKIIKSPAFLKADPKVVEAIYKLNTLNISEAQLINALERYIDHNKANNSEIAEKVRPALKHVRFLTLAAPDIAKTTLLTSEESLAVTRCLSSEAAVSKIPVYLSSNNQKRAFTSSFMDEIRKVSAVYSDIYCFRCIKYKDTASNHAQWNCPGIQNHNNSYKLREMYKKYNHVWLLDYDFDDLEEVISINSCYSHKLDFTGYYAN